MRDCDDMAAFARADQASDIMNGLHWTEYPGRLQADRELCLCQNAAETMETVIFVFVAVMFAAVFCWFVWRRSAAAKADTAPLDSRVMK